jgi:hypothetical protein
MAEEQKYVQKTKQQILDADPDSLTTAELERRALFIDLDHKELQRELVKRQTEKMKMTDAQNRDKFYSRGQELKKTDRDLKKHQDQCSHRKAGRGLEGLQKGGNSADYAVIRHILPTNELWQRCLRCAKTWRPPHAQDFDKSPSGIAAYEEAKRVYKEAVSWPTDNTTSSGITFNWDDGGEFAHEIMKGTTLR